MCIPPSSLLLDCYDYLQPCQSSLAITALSEFSELLNEPMEPVLDTFTLDDEKVVLEWNDASPAVRFSEKLTTSLNDALPIIHSIPNLQKKLSKDKKDILNKIALIINHLCNVEARPYRFIPGSAVFKQVEKKKEDEVEDEIDSESGTIVFAAMKDLDHYKVTLPLFGKGSVHYALVHPCM